MLSHRCRVISKPIDPGRLDGCKRCPRLQRQFKALRKDKPDYWNRPVPPSGPEDAAVLIVGLAPGLHGANRTGIPFTGDASGELLFKVLMDLGLESRVRITNAVKCLPPLNLPTTQEVNECRRFLEPELRAHPVILALGGVAHRAVIKALGRRQKDFPFVHGTIHDLGGQRLIDSYHCSRYNTQTGRLTEAMFRDVVELAGQHARLIE